MADGPASRPTEADRKPAGVLNARLQLRLTVWIDPDRTWHARAEWPRAAAGLRQPARTRPLHGPPAPVAAPQAKRRTALSSPLQPIPQAGAADLALPVRQRPPPEGEHNHCAIAKFVKGEVVIFSNPQDYGRNTLPSVVSYKKDKITVGNKAKEFLKRPKKSVIVGVLLNENGNF